MFLTKLFQSLYGVKSLTVDSGENNENGVTVYTKEQVDKMINNLDWKNSVSYFNEIGDTYPNPKKGWKVFVEADKVIYHFNGDEWEVILDNVEAPSYEIGLSTHQENGLMSSIDKIKLDNINEDQLMSKDEKEKLNQLKPVQLSTPDNDGLMSKEDKTKLDKIDLSNLDFDNTSGCELNWVNVVNFGAVGNGIIDDTIAIGEAVKSLTNGDVLYFPKGTYLVSKNQSLLGFINNDQPCIFLNGLKDVLVVGYGATLKVNEHAQGILELQDCTNVTVVGLNLRGCGQMVPIDSISGRGEKGTNTDGYDTDGYWGYYKNNSNNTSNNTGGSSSIPKPWGKFNGGYIGNVAFGILIHNGCNKITIDNCDIANFNYACIGVGHKGTIIPRDLNYPDSKDVTIVNCNLHDAYNSGIALQMCVGSRLIDNTISKIGHPDQLTYNGHVHYDPGYGITATGNIKSVAKDSIIRGNRVTDCARKGIDIHSGVGAVIIGNTIDNAKVGGIYGAWSDDTTQVSKQLIISNNIIRECGYVTPLGGIYIQGRLSNTKSLLDVSVTITDNQLINCSGGTGILYVRTFDRAIIKGNQILGASKHSAGSRYGILIGKSSNYSHNLICTDNIIDDMGNDKLVVGISLTYVNEGIVSNNVSRLSNNLHDVTAGIVANKNIGDVNFIGNINKLGSKGRPYNLSGTGQKLANIGTGGHLANVTV